MKVDFSEILNKEVGSAPQPKPVPAGTYIGTIDGLPKIVERNTKNGTKGILQVVVGLSEAGEDVDETELTECGGLVLDGGGRKKVRAEFWLEEDSMWQLDNFLATFGWVAGAGQSYQAALEELPGKEVKIGVIVDSFESNGVTKTNNKVKGIYSNE